MLKKTDLAEQTSFILFFDGACHLCNFWVDVLIRLDRRNKLQFASLQGETAQKFLTPEQIKNLNSLVLLKQNSTFEKSTAVIYTLTALQGLGWFARILFIIPKPFRDGIYDWFAKNRYRWFGKRESCRIPNEFEKGKLLN